jgi:hypothetical protein
MHNDHTPNQEDTLQAAVANIQDWVTATEFCQKFPNIPEKTLNWQLTCRHKNGLAPYVQVIGKQRFISMQGYAKWLQRNVRPDCD